MDFVATYQKIRINTNHKQFTCNHLGEIWGKENDDFKRFLLRVAFLQDNPEPKPWGAYSPQEKRLLHSFSLWLEQIADFQRVMKRESKLREKHINALD